MKILQVILKAKPIALIGNCSTETKKKILGGSRDTAATAIRQVFLQSIKPNPGDASHG